MSDPKDQKVSARISSKTKALAKKSKRSYGDLIEIGARHVLSELNTLKIERDFLNEDIERNKYLLIKKEKKLEEMDARIFELSPKDCEDKDLVDKMISDAAQDYADLIYMSHGDDSLHMVLEKEIFQNGIKREAKNNGYSPNLFLNEVIKKLDALCPTSVSDTGEGIV